VRYKIVFLPVARKELISLPHEVQKRIDKKIIALADDPRPHDVKALHGEKKLYRVRVGDYRIVYNVEDKVITVVIVRVRHRKDVYR
jgi:Cytotoxic translational repressor of toxin-antitoxin stability system